MKIDYPHIAAGYAESILRWIPSVGAVNEDYLRLLYEEIYRSGHVVKKDSYASEAAKEITFAGVRLAYMHFHDGNAHHFRTIKNYLVDVGPSAAWASYPRVKVNSVKSSEDAAARLGLPSRTAYVSATTSGERREGTMVRLTL